MFRKAIFWTHLACGVVAGLVILMMSVTGVLLTYERQMLDWAERRAVGAPEDDAPRLPAGALLEAARHQEPAFEPSSLTLAADPRMPAVLSAGRGNARLLDPYTGAILGDGEGGLHAFFDAVRGWHRWFNVEGEGRDAARAVTNACNLAFLFLVLSGAWLWLPPAFGRAALRVRFWFNPKARGGKARDYNWHHVFGIWSAVPKPRHRSCAPVPGLSAGSARPRSRRRRARSRARRWRSARWARRRAPPRAAPSTPC